MSVRAFLGIEERDATDERLARKALAGRMWRGWPGLVRHISVNARTGVVTLRAGSDDLENAVASAVLSTVYDLPIRVAQ